MSTAIFTQGQDAEEVQASDEFAAIKMAVLQTGRSIDEARALHGDYDDMCKALLGRSPDEADTFAVLDGKYPKLIDGYDLIVITGSKFGVYEGHDWIQQAERIVRDAFAQGIKMIGICFGHQLIAQALGATVGKSDHGFIVGAHEYEVIGLDGETSTLQLYAWHQDQVMTVPKEAEVIAETRHCPIAGLRYGNTAISLQPHPEFTKEYMVELIEARRGQVVQDKVADDALESLAKKVDPSPISKLFKDFVLAG